MRLAFLRTAFAVSFFLLNAPIAGQESFPDLVSQAFGLDQDLVNGVQYSNKYRNTRGHPYFLEDKFQLGSVSVDGRMYDDVWLKYDLLSQHVEIEYEDYSGGKSRLITVAERMGAFNFGIYNFRKMNLQGEGELYYQAIRTGFFTCYIHWDKRLVPVHDGAGYTGQFSDPRPVCRLEQDGAISPFHDRRSFARLFGEELQKEIIRFLKSEHISFRKNGPEELLHALNGVENILNQAYQP